ncbi:CLUMA_CG003292, isoform A [Clunio marinus]|uniref:CLUMA_CG003292, isoform A n=1 Tax=Clunio marinus TaxID=568069 RepID=A0A1J1HNJ3_9DIPT|nr:CLUMA_CG003292, isoform A [Clunio marinus]
MAGFLKSTDLGPHPHSYGGPHHPHHSHGPPLPPGMPMTSLAPFGLPHGLDAVGFPHQDGDLGREFFADHRQGERKKSYELRKPVAT